MTKFFYEQHMSAENYIVKKDHRFGQYIGQVTKCGNRWLAYLGLGVTAMGGTKDEAVMKALKKKREMEQHEPTSRIRADGFVLVLDTETRV